MNKDIFLKNYKDKLKSVEENFYFNCRVIRKSDTLGAIVNNVVNDIRSNDNVIKAVYVKGDRIKGFVVTVFYGVFRKISLLYSDVLLHHNGGTYVKGELILPENPETAYEFYNLIRELLADEDIKDPKFERVLKRKLESYLLAKRK